jgi:poly(A) polymerase
MTGYDAAHEIVSRLRAGGHEAYFAGGCVRDMLLERTPKDYDVATKATPQEIQTVFPSAHGVGAHFGVVIVKLGSHPIEIATFRTDGSYSDGRRPDSVAFSTAEEDAQRRDFTINGVFFDPLEKRYLDYVGGQADLAARCLRAIGNPEARFREDYLRLLRAVRFAATLDFSIDPATLRAMKDCAPGLAKISVERIQAEFSRMMMLPNRVQAFDLLVETGLMAVFLPEILCLQGVEQPPQWHPEGDVYVHTRLMLSLLAPDAPLELVLSVLLHDIGKPATYSVDETGRIRFSGHDAVGAEMAQGILQRLKYPTHVVDAVKEMVARHMQYMNVQDMRKAKLKRFMARPTFELELEMHRVDCAGSNGFTDNYEFLLAKRDEFAHEPLIPPKLLDGHDLIALGYPSGKELGVILTEVQTQQLEGILTTREAALAYVVEHFPLPQ